MRKNALALHIRSIFILGIVHLESWSSVAPSADLELILQRAAKHQDAFIPRLKRAHARVRIGTALQTAAKC
ncbi:hypothetical protein LMTR3_21155 [Bradyrhizobium sp. LMTR 3]|nr:hypothetical protein LMTR3_21155 [Bradyrhizobium sp. LMTR 3]